MSVFFPDWHSVSSHRLVHLPSFPHLHSCFISLFYLLRSLIWFFLSWFQTSLSTFIIKIFKTVSYFCCILNLRSELSLWLVSAPFSTTLTYCSTEVPIAAHHTEGRTKFDVFYTVSPDKERSSSKVWYDNLLTYYFIRALLYENTSLGWAAVQIRERKSWGKRDYVCVCY